MKRRWFIVVMLVLISLFISPVAEAYAYNLEVPTLSYNDFQKVDYPVIFLGGRMLEFTKETGYPYKKSGKLMVPAEAICNGIYGVWNYQKSTATIMRHGVTITAKKGKKTITVDDHGSKRKITCKLKSAVKGGKFYIQLSGIADALGLKVKVDDNTGIINLNYSWHFKHIDLKQNEDNLVSLKDVKPGDYEQIFYDMAEISDDYLNVLKNTDQYKAFIDIDLIHKSYTESKVNKETLFIFSYQLFENIDYLYGKAIEFARAYDNRSTEGEASVILENICITDGYKASLMDEEDFLFTEVDDKCEEPLFWEIVYSWSEIRSKIEIENLSTNTIRFVDNEPMEGSLTYTCDMHKKVMEKIDEAIAIGTPRIEKDLKEHPEWASIETDVQLARYFYEIKQFRYKNGAQKGHLAYDYFFTDGGKCTAMTHVAHILMRKIGCPFVQVNGPSHMWGLCYDKAKKKWRAVSNLKLYQDITGISEGNLKDYIPFVSKEERLTMLTFDYGY